MEADRSTFFADKMRRYAAARSIAESHVFTPTQLAAQNIQVRSDGVKRSLFSLLGQQDIDRGAVLALSDDLGEVDPEIINQIAIDALYHQYAERQTRDAELLQKEEAIQIPDDLDYDSISGLSNELKSKLNAARPMTLAAAARIEGITPAALTLLIAVIKSMRRQTA
ncbi:hypothetical protein PE067_02635 [Paracoccus sp. DMF-8]|uniref:hypothetical protein n=1 Tax=Paracoccus sp. DMF-8 TaxID=3019445 RepID=UPI0023E7D34C|nr:hypothetical protein [Paracoccus sp. DMF-8]MDF3605154.1 hypothetical protein [Paracoccus sp. DMF-8]